NFSADSLQPGPSGANGRRYVWTSWSDSGARTHNFTVPGSDSMIAVNFGLQYELVTSATPPAGGTINPPSQSFHNAGDTISVRAQSANGYAFTSWSGSATGTANPISLIMDTTKALTANFSPAAIVRIISTPPGRTIVVDGFSYVAPDTFNWLLGSTHSIGTVTPQSGEVGTRHLWSAWSDTGSLSHSVTVSGDTLFDVSFMTQYYLFLGTDDTNGTVGPAEGWRDAGSVVEITATPTPGYGFVQWSGTGPASYSGFSNPVNLLMNGYATQVASFGQLLPPPGLAGIQNGAIDQPIIPQLTWMSYAGADSFIVQVSTDSLFSPAFNVVDTSGIKDTTIQLPVLLNFQKYYWRVKARVGPNITSFSQTRNFTTLKPTISVTSPAINWGTTYTYDITWTAQNLSGRVDVMLSTDGGQTFVILDSNRAGTSTRWSIPLAQTPSNLCRIRVASTFKPALFAESGNFAIVPGSLPLIVPLTASISFPAEPTISTFYRLVSAPGVIDTSIHLSTYIPGTNPKDWRMFADNGQPDNYLVEMGPASNFETGRGFWLVKRNNLDIAANMIMPPLDTMNAVYRIKVRSGWNILANPFDKNVAWSSVVALNGLPPSTELYGYEGSYQVTNIMAPFRGYYFFNGINLTDLKISYPFGASSNTRVAARVVDWQIRLDYQSEINEDPSNFIGVAPAAKAGLDELDGYKPPIFLDQGFLYFKRPEWNREYSLFNADFRHEIGEGQTWEFEVSREYGTTGTIRFEGVDAVPPAYEVVLMNSYNSTPVDLREKNSYSFSSVSTTMPFKILVGPPEYVRAQIAAETPKEFELEQNFPNPFNSTTSISVKLPRDAKISLDVYSLLGQKVKTLAEGKYTGGVHTFLWEGTDDNRMPVASGVYIYRLTDGQSLLQSRKMIIVK
ncbi:MAG TPA: T9SS type A sorting domain-containing protein, partial [Bacteroidota bacterium]|nr:T9SS type A sorting domain-containing protein [Bacteroidota bacterium]